jgi:hypothetical protein
MALERVGDLAGALDEYRVASLFTQQLPWVRSLEAGCLARMGRLNEARAIRDQLRARRRTEYVDPSAIIRIELAIERGQDVAARTGAVRERACRAPAARRGYGFSAVPFR